MDDISNDIYNLSHEMIFKNHGIENKFIRQTNNYFSASYKFLLALTPILLSLDQKSAIPLILFLALFLSNFYHLSRFLIYFLTTLSPGHLSISLLVDWVIHTYTLRNPIQFTGLTLIRMLYWKISDYKISSDLIFSSVILIYFSFTLQGTFRDLWKNIEHNKRKMIQEKTVLNEIQCALLVFDSEENLLSSNTKAFTFLKTRGITSIEKLKIVDIFPEYCHIRVKDLFQKALNGHQTDEEFLFSHELESIPPVFSTVVISLKKVPSGDTIRVHMTIIDTCNTIMRRRFLAANQRIIEESSLIIESQFIELYLAKKPLKNHHIRSLNHYLLEQRDLLVLMNNYLGESEVVNEYFTIKDEVVNTVHTCWRGAKAKRMKITLICEQVLPKQVFGDNIKHNQLLRSLLEFAILTGDIGTEISVSVNLHKFIKEACIEYKLIYFSKLLTCSELENIFRIRKHSKIPKVLEEMIGICEKYGLGISIFDVLLTIVNGYVGELMVQESIHRVIISYM